MKTIVCLAPCLMQENTRKINKSSLDRNITTLVPDDYVLYDQCFKDTDYDSRFEYIAHAKKKMGFVGPRNALLNWFYDSDYDYALWIDANSVVSRPTLNDIRTIMELLRQDRLPDCDAIFASLGMWGCTDRIRAKSAEDYFQKIHLLPTKNNCSWNWMHGLIHVNYKKKYNQRFLIDERCNVNEGTAEDVTFARTIQRFSNCWVCPTVVINKPSVSFSTHQADNGKYAYPPTLFDKIDDYILETAEKNNYQHVNPNLSRKEIVIDRNEDFKDLLRPYKPKEPKKSKIPDLKGRINLFEL